MGLFLGVAPVWACFSVMAIGPYDPYTVKNNNLFSFFTC